jgi:hypothetical protein
MKTQALPRQKVTLYFRGEFFGNYQKVEASALNIEIRNYAQYSSAVSATFTPKGARLPRGKWFTYEPSLVVLAGWGHFEPAPMMAETGEEVAGVAVSESRRTACDDGWAVEFREMLAAYIEKTGARVLHDFHGHNAYAPFIGPLPPTPAERYAAQLAAMKSFTHFDANGDGCACETPCAHAPAA